MRKQQLGKSGAVVSVLGLGCFGMSGAYGAVDPAAAEAAIHHALDLGCTFFDTADSYGSGANEELLARALEGRREEVVLATKAGFVWDENGQVVGRNGRPDYIRAACEASLRRLRTTTLDLLYLHRMDPGVALEETVGAMGELIAEGKVRFLGVSELGADNLRRAHAVHPITALQSEYSLWARDPEREILPLCEELGIGFVAFSPLGRGAFTNDLWQEGMSATDFRRHLPRFQGDRQLHLRQADCLQELAKRKGCTPAQLALAWVLASSHGVTAVPGASRLQHVEENLRAAEIYLSAEEYEECNRLFPAVTTPRYTQDSLFKPD